MYYATAVLYVVMASVLSTFNIEGVDSEGKPVKIEAKFSDCERLRLFVALCKALTSSTAFISYAEEFPCRITPRGKIDTTIL